MFALKFQALKDIHIKDPEDVKGRRKVVITRRSLWFAGVARNAVVVVLASVLAFFIHRNKQDPLILTGKLLLLFIIFYRTPNIFQLISSVIYRNIERSVLFHVMKTSCSIPHLIGIGCEDIRCSDGDRSSRLCDIYCFSVLVSIARCGRLMT